MSKQTKVELTKVLVVIETIIASRKERTVYFRDGRIFRFVGADERSAFIGRYNWNKLYEKEFEEEFLNDNK